MFDDILAGITNAPNFPEGFDWVNANEQISLEKLEAYSSIGFLDLLLHKLYAYDFCPSRT